MFVATAGSMTLAIDTKLTAVEPARTSPSCCTTADGLLGPVLSMSVSTLTPESFRA